MIGRVKEEIGEGSVTVLYPGNKPPEVHGWKCCDVYSFSVSQKFCGSEDMVSVGAIPPAPVLLHRSWWSGRFEAPSRRCGAGPGRGRSWSHGRAARRAGERREEGGGHPVLQEACCEGCYGGLGETWVPRLQVSVAGQLSLQGGGEARMEENMHLDYGWI